MKTFTCTVRGVLVPLPMRSWYGKTPCCDGDCYRKCCKVLIAADCKYTTEVDQAKTQGTYFAIKITYLKNR